MQGAVQKKREQMKKEKLLRLAGLIGAMFVLLACSVFSSVAPTASVTPTEVVTSTVELPASTATAIATSIPAVQEPTIVIRL
jgi:multidrug efflux pump subunit AcrA (membrane-fusion protein)